MHVVGMSSIKHHIVLLVLTSNQEVRRRANHVLVIDEEAVLGSHTASAVTSRFVNNGVK